jgi:peptidoglycan/xylan/chitin deacetylase (PgdA/CDA1 family)
MIRRRIERVRRRARKAVEHHALVLMYHRVAEAASDPWGLCVRPTAFSNQLESLRRWADIVPLEEVTQRLQRPTDGRPQVALTFDDGYTDNLEVAKPLLQRYNAPATVVLTTRYVGYGGPFWWDALAELLLDSRSLPARLQLDVEPTEFRFVDRLLQRTDAAGDAARRRLHYGLWSYLSALTFEQREAVVRQLQVWSGREATGDAMSRPMTEAQVRTLVADDLVAVGAHSATHRMLSRLSYADKNMEIRESHDGCLRLTGYAPLSFAYPHGDFDAECVGLVQAAGFALACTSRPDLIWSAAERFEIPRVVVGDWTGPDLLRRLRRGGYA